MLVAKRVLWLAALTLLGLALLVWIVGEAPSFQSCVSQTGRAENSQGNQNPKQSAPHFAVFRGDWDCLGQFVDLNNAAITAAATALLTLITAGLVWVGAMQISTSRAQLRAYVAVSEAHLENIGVGRVPFAVLTVKNFGQTPAYEMTNWARIGFDVYPLTDGPPQASKGDSLPSRMLAPQGEMIVRPKFKGQPPLNPVTLDALQNGSHAIYVDGEINYVDAFGRNFRTTYLLFGGGPIGFSGELAAYRTGNDAT